MLHISVDHNCSPVEEYEIPALILFEDKLNVSNSADVHFGLGQNPMIDRLTVTWPDGAVDSWEDIEASQRVRISR